MLDFLRKKVAKDAMEIDNRGVNVVIDKALRIWPDEAMEALEKGGARSVEQVLVIPSAAGKHVSPLDNCLWANWKKTVRSKQPQTVPAICRAMVSAWKGIKKGEIWNSYRHCGLTKRQRSHKGHGKK